MQLALDDPAATQRDLTFGWVALSCAIPSGFYRLQYRGEKARELPIYVFPERATQVFLLRDGEPLFRAMRTFMRSSGKPFIPQDDDAMAVDNALAGLETGIAEAGMALPVTRVQDLLTGKFRNPMFGLIAAYWLVLQDSAGPQYVDLVLGNLDALLPRSADVIALRAAAARRFGRPMPLEKPAAPPLILAGAHILRHYGLIAADSLSMANSKSPLKN